MPIEKHSVIVGGRKTSVSLEAPFWNCLKEIADEKNTSVAQIVKQVANERSHANLSSAIRLFVLSSVQSMIGSLPLGRDNAESTSTTARL
jgi:predicted DNA-binding ribbon-helix-helix protein